MPLLEQVFKKSGIPDITFVEPKEFPKVSVALRTPGRGIVIEGPSGIGKTTCLHRAIEKEGLNKNCLFLSGRKKKDIELIKSLPELLPFQIVIVDDFHKLDEHIQNILADLLKVLADEERQDSKLVLMGINRAGQNLIDYAPDLLNRVEVIRLGKANDERIKHLIQLGEEALRCKIHCSPDIINEVQGSFAMAQLICHELCIQANHLSNEIEGTIDTSLPSAREAILRDLHPRFFPVSRDFSTGKRLRKEGRAPYLHLLLWLSETEEGVLDIKDALAANPKMKGSVTQVIEKKYLQQFLDEKDDISSLIHFNGSTILTVEDPKFLYFIRHLIWNKFARQIGYFGLNFASQYDFALSFSGEDRAYAEKIFELLQEQEIYVFYDRNEQDRIIGNDVEEYLAPIYRSQARFVLALLSNTYSKKIWTKFESENFKNRFGEGSIIPIWFSDVSSGMFDNTQKVGGLTIDRNLPTEEACNEVIQILRKKIAEDRQLEISFEEKIEDIEL